ncbi:hypothetical protein AUP68_13938 [Ilyonectria robusta]
MASVPYAPIPFDLGPRTPMHLSQVARAALIQGSEYDISEGPIPGIISTPTPAPDSALLGDEALIDISMFDAIEPAELLADPLADLLADLPGPHSPPSSDVFEHSKTSEPALAINLSAAVASVALESQAILDDKMKVFRTFCAAFDETAKQFPTGHLPLRRAAEPEFDDYQPARTRGNAPDPQRRPSGPRQARRPREQQQQENPTIAYDDTRVFVRLHENSPAWDKQPFAIRTHLADKLGIKLDAIPQASRTKTGWAIRPANLDIRNKIINEEACWAPALGADAVELATKWITYVVSECPRSLTDLFGKTVDYEAALKDEVEAQTGLRAVSCRPSRNDDPTQPTKTLLISFLEQLKHAFCLFGTSRLARLIQKTARPNQCNLCWDYHSRHSCDRTARCQVGPHRNQGARIAAWIEDNDLAVLNQPNQPTNKYNNTLDLAISNIPTAQARVEDHLATSSDHYTLSISLPVQLTPPQVSRIRVRIEDPDDLVRLAEAVAQGQDFLPTAATTAEDLDFAAAQLLELLQDAIRVIGRSPQRNGRSAPWWTKDCAKAHSRYQSAKRRDPKEDLGPITLARDDFPRGPPADKVRLAIKACVLPVLFYGAEAWYPGKTAPPLRSQGPEVSTRIDHLLDRFKKVLLIGIRSILPTWKTTPLAALYRESGIPPVEQLLDAIRLRHAARLQALDPRHPLTARAVIPSRRPGQKPIYKTRLQRTALLLPPSPRLVLLQRKYSLAQLHIQPKDIAVPAFLAWIETLSAIDLIVYSDGSRSSGGAAGYGTRFRRVRRDDRGNTLLPRHLPPSPLGTLA